MLIELMCDMKVEERRKYGWVLYLGPENPVLSGLECSLVIHEEEAEVLVFRQTSMTIRDEGKLGLLSQQRSDKSW